MNKPAYLRLAILELRKILMYEKITTVFKRHDSIIL